MSPWYQNWVTTLRVFSWNWITSRTSSSDRSISPLVVRTFIQAPKRPPKGPASLSALKGDGGANTSAYALFLIMPRKQGQCKSLHRTNNACEVPEPDTEG